jgi:ABC-type transport system involved in multi-copper enzyme maturation permease subunit
MIRLFWTLISQVFKENFKNKLFQLLVVFGVVVIYASLLVSAMAVEQEHRALVDFGFGLIKIIGLISIIFITASTILKDIESKTIYLVLSRPVARWQYVLGKYFGLVLSVAVAMILMGAAFSILLLVKGYALQPIYLAYIFSSVCKVIILGAFTLLISSFSTSMLSCVMISVIFWTMGHFLAESRFIVEKLGFLLQILLAPVILTIPDMGAFNYFDILHANGNLAVFHSLIYMTMYSAGCLLLCIAFFKDKEF